MDRSWISSSGRTEERHINGLLEFMAFLRENSREGQSYHHCPCRKCSNAGNLRTENEIWQHLLMHGMERTYNLWVHHGEENPALGGWSGVTSSARTHSANPAVNLMNDVFSFQGGSCSDDQGQNVGDPGPSHQPGSPLTYRGEYDKYRKLMEDAHKPIYEGCQYDLLSTVMEAMDLKSKYGKTNSGYDADMRFLKKLLPQPNLLPDTTRGTLKILSDLGLGEWEKLDVCFVCNEDRYYITSSGNKIPRKFIHYFLIGPRLQRFYMCSHTSKHMRWHATRDTVSPDYMVHLSDGEAWKHFDRTFPEFAEDPHNVRLGLSTDGFNPTSNLKNPYSIWPVIVFPYNFPPNMCMQKEYNLLALMIPGPKSPGKCIDVFL